MKGLLVIGMVLAHVVQFFYQGDGYNHPFSSFINQVTFPGFIFCFGYVFYVAYLRKEGKSVVIRMIVSLLKCQVAFYISGFAFRVLKDHTRYSWKGLWKILILSDLPGWSEFLAAFAVVTLVGILLYVPLKKLLNYPVFYWCITGLLLVSTYIPYEKIKINQLGLVIGTANFPCFPALQYFPYFMIGIYFAKKEILFQIRYMLGSLLITAGVMVYVILKGMPERFPPTLLWIVLPAFYLYLYYMVSQLLSYLSNKITGINLVAHFGSKSLFYLVISNIFIFAFAGANMGKFKLLGCGIIALLMISIIYYLEIISKDRIRKNIIKETSL